MYNILTSNVSAIPQCWDWSTCIHVLYSRRSEGDTNLATILKFILSLFEVSIPTADFVCGQSF